MRTAQDFPITTGYGKAPGYTLNNGWHRGEDRAMPMDTPVVVNGIEIGLSGNSGSSTGPHLHIGRFVGGGDTAPNGGGFDFQKAVVTEVNQDAVNGKYVRLQADGASWVYLHLSRQSVPVGQELVRPASAPVSVTIAVATPDTNFQQKEVVITKPGGANKWGVNWAFDYRASHPLGFRNEGERFTAVGLIHTTDGNSYYRDDPNSPDGYHVADCADYVPPIPVYVPPAPPVTVPKIETYLLVTTVMTFDKPEDAKYKKNAKGTLNAGEYIVVGKKEECYQLVKKNMDTTSFWINTTDNVEPVIEAKPVEMPTPPPVPSKVSETIQDAAAVAVKITEPVKPVTPDWIATKAFLNTDASPEYFYSINSAPYAVQDYSDKQGNSSDLPPYTQNIPIVATYQKDGSLWGLPKHAYETGRLYLIPMRLLKLQKPGIMEKIEQYANNLIEAGYRIVKYVDGIKQTRIKK